MKKQHREVKCLATFTVLVSDRGWVGTSAVWVQADWGQVVADEGSFEPRSGRDIQGCLWGLWGGLVCDCNSFVHNVLILNTTQVVVTVGVDKEGGSLLIQCGDRGDIAECRVVSAVRIGREFTWPLASE